jgi:hypothetical protein
MDIQHDSYSAWQYLVQCGGLELDGRDKGFDAELLEVLRITVPSAIAEPNPARTLTEALDRTPLATFLRAFFTVTQPYLRMFKAILEYFEAAGAKEGRQHWCLRLDRDEELSLDNFRTQLAKWQSAKGTVRVPALDVSGAWRIREIFIQHRHDEANEPGVIFEQPANFPQWLKSWLRSYESGERLPLPQEALQDDVPKQFHSIVPFICAFAHRRMELGLNRQAAHERLHKRGWRHPDGDALNPWSVVAMESDRYLRQLLDAMYVARAHPRVRNVSSDLRHLGSLV